MQHLAQVLAAAMPQVRVWEHRSAVQYELLLMCRRMTAQDEYSLAVLNEAVRSECISKLRSLRGFLAIWLTVFKGTRALPTMNIA
jgi:hypothetical protein